MDTLQINVKAKPNYDKTDADFLNICAKCYTKHNPDEVLSKIGIIENELGIVRNKTERYTSRTIDIDIILFNDYQIGFEILLINACITFLLLYLSCLKKCFCCCKQLKI